MFKNLWTDIKTWNRYFDVSARDAYAEGFSCGRCGNDKTNYYCGRFTRLQEAAYDLGYTVGKQGFDLADFHF